MRLCLFCRLFPMFPGFRSQTIVLRYMYTLLDSLIMNGDVPVFEKLVSMPLGSQPVPVRDESSPSVLWDYDN